MYHKYGIFYEASVFCLPMLSSLLLLSILTSSPARLLLPLFPRQFYSFHIVFLRVAGPLLRLRPLPSVRRNTLQIKNEGLAIIFRFYSL